MAQDFESLFQTKIQSGSFTTLMTSDSDDAVIGIRFANLHSGSVSVDAKITRSATDFHLIKNAPIPVERRCFKSSSQSNWLYRCNC